MFVETILQDEYFHGTDMYYPLIDIFHPNMYNETQLQ